MPLATAGTNGPKLQFCYINWLVKYPLTVAGL